MRLWNLLAPLWLASFSLITYLLSVGTVTAFQAGNESTLAGTSWQLIKFQGGDDELRLPIESCRPASGR